MMCKEFFLKLLFNDHVQFPLEEAEETFRCCSVVYYAYLRQSCWQNDLIQTPSLQAFYLP